MKWIKELFFLLLILFFVIYVLGVFHQGYFDISLWSQGAREAALYIGAMGSMMVTVVKLFLG